MPIGRDDYEERKERKIDTFQKRSRKASKTADQQIEKARRIGSFREFGQPILVGHHSEKRHRADIAKQDAAHRKANDEYEKAAYYQGKAESAENNNSISGDNPEALTLYKNKLEKLEALQERMKAVNKAWKKGADALHALGFSDEDIENTKAKMSTYEKLPFPSWALSNNSAEIRRVKEKIESLAKLDDMVAELIKFDGGEMCVDVEINRVQFIFDGKPSEKVRSLLKSNGFRWAPSEGAWQRQRTLQAIRIAKRLIPELEAMQ